MRISLGHLTIADTSASELVSIASRLHFDAACFYLKTPTKRPFAIGSVDSVSEALSLKQQMDDAGFGVGTTESFAARPDISADQYGEMLDIAAALGAKRVTALNYCHETDLAIERFVRFCELADSYGLNVGIECYRLSACRTLQDAARLIGAVGAANLRLTVDVLHMVRNGDTVAHVAALDPALIDYAQISDGPAEADADAHAMEALCDRGLPGEGVFPLTDLIRVLPEATTVCIEAPMQRYSASMTPLERAALARRATMALLHRAGR